MLSDIASEMPDMDFDESEQDMEFTEILRNLGLDVEDPLTS